MVVKKYRKGKGQAALLCAVMLVLLALPVCAEYEGDVEGSYLDGNITYDEYMKYMQDQEEDIEYEGDIEYQYHKGNESYKTLMKQLYGSNWYKSPSTVEAAYKSGTITRKDYEAYLAEYVNKGKGSGGGNTGSANASKYAITYAPNLNDQINMYNQANTASNILRQYPGGLLVLISKNEGGWCHAQTANEGIAGYFRAQDLAFGSGAGNERYAYVVNPNGGDVVNFRSGKNTSSNVLAELPVGTCVWVKGYASDWCMVEVGDQNGYVNSNFLFFQTPPSYQATVANLEEGQQVNLRIKASTDSQSLGSYGNGAAVTVLYYEPEWCRVDVGGIQGYMMTRYLYFPTGGVAPQMDGSGNNDTVG